MLVGQSESGTSYLFVRDGSGMVGLYDLQQPQRVEQLSPRCGRSDVAPVCDAWWIRDFGQPEALQVMVTRRGLDRFDAGELVWSFVDADWQTVAQILVVP